MAAPTNILLFSTKSPQKVHKKIGVLAPVVIVNKTKYGDNDNKRVMTSINCFRDCLCCDPKDHQEHSFKLKKGLKCITSEKRRGIIATQIPTQYSRTTETNKFS